MGVHIMLVAGEPSGDMLGAQLMVGLREAAPGFAHPLSFSGVGGAHMQAEGLKSLFDLSDIAVMGIGEVIPRLPVILRRLKLAENTVVAQKPDVLVIIDSPDFTQRLARRVARRAPDILIVNYVAPQVWAWRRQRAYEMGRYIDHLLALLPFEVPFFTKTGLRTSFVGHPVVERLASQEEAGDFRARHGIARDAPVLLLLPGSRAGEIVRHMRIFGEVGARLSGKIDELHIVLPTLAHLHPLVETLAASWSVTPLIVTEDEKNAAIRAGSVALAASGTVSLELAAARVPMVIGYRVNPLTALVFRLAVRLPSVVLFNIVAGENIVPELLQSALTPEAAERELLALLTDEKARAAQLNAADRVMEALGGDGMQERPSRRAARAIWTTIAETRLEEGRPAPL
jgi:lipid-A-disaccharide synthase